VSVAPPPALTIGDDFIIHTNAFVCDRRGGVFRVRRTKAAAQETREEIFRAGIKVFAEKGYTAATLADVAREAGCTRGAIYWHFRNKEAFFAETVQRLNRFYDELLAPALDHDGEPLDMICSAVATVLRKFARDPEFRRMQELAARAAIGGTGGFAVEQCDGQIRGDDSHAITLLDRAISAGAIYDGWDGATALRALTSYVSGVFLMIMERDLHPTDDEIDDLVAFVRRGFASGTARSTTGTPEGERE